MKHIINIQNKVNICCVAHLRTPLMSNRIHQMSDVTAGRRIYRVLTKTLTAVWGLYCKAHGLVELSPDSSDRRRGFSCGQSPVEEEVGAEQVAAQMTWAAASPAAAGKGRSLPPPLLRPGTGTRPWLACERERKWERNSPRHRSPLWTSPRTVDAWDLPAWQGRWLEGVGARQEPVGRPGSPERRCFGSRPAGGLWGWSWWPPWTHRQAGCPPHPSRAGSFLHT